MKKQSPEPENMKHFKKVIAVLANASLFVWEKLQAFWSMIALPWIKNLTPKKVLKIAGITFVAGVLCVVLLFVVLSFGLPTVESLKDYKPSPGTIIYAEDGRVLGQVRIEKGSYVPLARVPKFLKDAVLATEDPRFYEHQGIDYRGILRAAVRNIIAIKVTQGGSTITQQLTKVVFLSPERKFKRKIKEIILARRLEKELTKDEILELYFNKIYFGHGAYGVQMAAKTYFGKNIWEINYGEAALLAGLPKSPMSYSPYSDIDLTKLRQAHVLKRMVTEGYITEDQSIKIYNQPLSLENLRPQEEVAPHVVDFIRRYIEKKYGSDKLYQGGLKVYTTINADLQRAAVNSLREGLRALDKRQGFRGRVGFKKLKSPQSQWATLNVMVKPGEGFLAQVLEVGDNSITVKGRGMIGTISQTDMTWALLKRKKKKEDPTEYKKPTEILQPGDIIRVRLKDFDKKKQLAAFLLDQRPLVEGAVVSLEPFTGYVRVMVGGYDFMEGGFNHATEAKRQPGSAFKPFIYGAALEHGFTPASILMDLPVIYEKSEFNKKGWKPTNYDERFLGPMRLRTALAKSRNAVTVGLLEKVGLNDTIAFARKAGISSAISYDYTTALGSSVVTPLELTSAYATFASKGIHTEPLVIRSIVDGSGTVLESYSPQPVEAIDKTTAFLVTSLLKSVVEEGTGRGARVLQKPIAGKTGTTNRYVDAWFVGYTPSIVTGVWVGYDNAQASLGDQEVGGRVALPIWIGVMAKALADKPAQDFAPTDDVVFRKIDPESGLLARDGQTDAITDVFRRGTEPTQYPDTAQRKTGFFDMDQGDGGVAPKKKIDPDEIED
jgi:penicillin-binding protein 1A